MRYSSALDFLLSRTDFERWPGYQYAARFDLRRMEFLLDRLGNTQEVAKSIHIAGSKGKGSTAAMIAAGLQAAGHRTGLYTSPHLVTLRERIKVDGRPVSKSDLARVTAAMRPVVEQCDADCPYGELSTFELLTAAAFLYFRERDVEYQVLETGLGGRLDATNVITPDVSVITTIGYDHTEVLGHTLSAIAGEKAGIIKPGVPVISSSQDPEAAKTIAAAAAAQGSPLTEVGTDLLWACTDYGASHQTMTVIGPQNRYEVTIPLLGEHQLENAAAAVAALEVLGVAGRDIARGLAGTEWTGRLQRLRRRPLLVVDGAHTGESARRLKAALERHFDFDRLVLIIGTSADKDVAAIVAELAPAANVVIATRSRHPRATEPRLVAKAFEAAGTPALTAGDVATALASARREAGRRDLICATGSLFVVAEVIEKLRRLRPETYT